MIEIVMLSVLALCFITQMIFYWVVLAKPYYYMKAVKKGRILFFSGFLPVSVIIYAQNRFCDLHKFLLPLLEQDYPQFEVIVVNDGTVEENTAALIRLQEQYPNLYCTHIPEETKYVSRKQLGFTLGVKAAKYNCLLFAEASGSIRSKNWIMLMARHFGKEKNMVLGICAKTGETHFFKKFMAFDYFYLNLHLLSMALFNRHYAGNSRNLICSKTYFDEQNKFFRQMLVDRHVDTAVELSAESVIMVDLNDSEWKQEKYKAGTVALWNVEFLSGLFFILAVTASLVWGFLHPYTLPYMAGAAVFCYLARLFSQLFVVNKTASFLKLEKFFITIPLFDLLQMMVNIYFFICCLVLKKEKYIFKYDKR
ncbi:MAG: glycosyltransferase [Dysgonamonadaceae bacterium]|nr:glycosyltransferase [Dysgonamonadaceae bacterium]